VQVSTTDGRTLITSRQPRTGVDLLVPE